MDRRRVSIAEIEGMHLSRPGAEASHFHRRCHEAATKPLSDLTASDLRVLISQDIGLRYVLPIALEIVETAPLLESDHFKGDLLAAILRASKEFYREHPELRARVAKLLETLPAALDTLDYIDFDTTCEALEEASSNFR